MRLIDVDAIPEMGMERCDTDDFDEIKSKVCGRNHMRKIINDAPTITAVPVPILKPLLMQYFCIGNDCYTYELTRVKEAFELGTMTLDDFVEWDEAQVDDLVSYIADHVAGGATV